MDSDSPKLVITSGEPAGIGPDITLEAFRSDLHSLDAQVAVIGDINVLRDRSKTMGMTLDFRRADQLDKEFNGVPVIHVESQQPVSPGKLNSGNSSYVIDCINRAVDLCLSGHYDGMVTAPVHKGIINDSGISFSGHTEWIANQCHATLPVMMLANDQMRVCLATTHLPLRAVPEAITQPRLTSVINVMKKDLKTLYGIDNPVIGVCGLNPHAGENGHLGREEIEVIIPTLNNLKHQGMHLLGPLPADTAFTQAQLSSMDAILAMYHDQGLPVVKHNDFGNVVNVTLGLPIIRTSVDHGTALELAGTSKATATSLLSAIKLAAQFASQRIRRTC